MGLAAAAMAGGSIISGMMQSNAAQSAADTQAAAADRASQQAMAQYQQTRADLSPYMGYGTTAGNQLVSQLPQLTSQFNPTQAQLEAMPGYQFTRDQGLQSVQSDRAAKGLGISGAAWKGAADYATGLANKTVNDAFNIDQSNKTNAFNKLLSLTQTGATAASGAGQQGLTATQNAGNFSTSGANASAAGTVGSANALSSGLSNSSNILGQYQLLNNLTGGKSSGY